PRPCDLHDRWGYLTNVYARPEVRGRGIGTALLRRAIADARERSTLRNASRCCAPRQSRGLRSTLRNASRCCARRQSRGLRSTFRHASRCCLGRAGACDRHSATLRVAALAEPGLAIDTPQRFALLRALAEPGLAIDTPQRFA